MERITERRRCSPTSNLRNAFNAGHNSADVADLLQEYEAKIGALKRMMGRQALEIELSKGAMKHGPRPTSESTSIVTGPVGSPSVKVAS